MIDTKNLVDKLINEYHIEEVVGVPCSTMTYLINELENRGIYTPYVNEGDAVAYAAGRNIDGLKVAVILQNSGLTNASSPISSLTSLYDIPMLYFVGYRGAPSTVDEPQHKIIGKRTTEFINTITDYCCEIVDLDCFIDNPPVFENYDEFNQKFVLVSKGELSSIKSEMIYFTRDLFNSDNSRYELIKRIKQFAEDHEDVVVLTTTGFTSREMMSLGEDFSRNFYMLGSMGCLTSFATGISISHPDKKVIVIDGDGSALMRLESKWTPYKYENSQVYRIVVNNYSHESTGGQFISDSIKEFNNENDDFYLQFEDIDTLINNLKYWYENSSIPSPVNVLNISSSKVVKDLPRPKLTPIEIKNNFIKGLNS